MLVAGALRFAGWQPSGMKNNGELLQPPTDLRDVTPQLEAGGEYAWKPEARRWRLLVAPPAGCGDPCHELAPELAPVWPLFGNQRSGERRVGKEGVRTVRSRLSPRLSKQ